jgi:hypothetical protein
LTDVIGEFSESMNQVTDGLTLTFSASSIPLKQRWRNNGLSADFLADYVTTFFPRDEGDPSSLERQQAIRCAVAYIANELLENAMKYSEESLAVPTTIRVSLVPDAILFSEVNRTSGSRGAAFLGFVRTLSASDPSEMYLQQLERAGEGGGSGLGLLTMLNDYGARLAWRFEDLPDGSTQITTQVRLDI